MISLNHKVQRNEYPITCAGGCHHELCALQVFEVTFSRPTVAVHVVACISASSSARHVEAACSPITFSRLTVAVHVVACISASSSARHVDAACSPVTFSRLTVAVHVVACISASSSARHVDHACSPVTFPRLTVAVHVVACVQCGMGTAYHAQAVVIMRYVHCKCLI
jgi:hypothetical protein